MQNIYIVVANENTSSEVKHVFLVVPLRHPDYKPTSLYSYSLMLHVCGEAGNTNFIVFGPDRGSNQQYTILLANLLPIIQ